MSTLQFGNIVETCVELPGAAGSAPWKVKVYLVGDSWALNLLNDAGRGDGKWPGSIPGSSTGTITFSGKIHPKVFPNPDTLNGQALTLVKRYSSGATESVPIRVHARGTSFKLGKDGAGEEFWDIKATAQITDQPTLTGFGGSQVVSVDDSFSDKVLWGGLQLKDDPKSLDQLVTYRLRVYGTTETTAAELTALQSHFTDSAPLTGLKLRPITMTRVSASIIYFNFVWSVRDTLQDIEFLQSVKRTEATFLDNRNIVVKVTNSSTPPTASGINPDSTNLDIVWQDSHQVTNLGYWVHVSYFAKFNPSDEMIESFKEVTFDPVGFMVANDKRLTINQSATPISAPSVTDSAGTSMVCVRRLIKRIGKTQYGHYFWYDYKSTVLQMTDARKHTHIDVSGISNSAATAEVWLVPGGAPSAPTLSGFVLTDYVDFETPNALYRIRVYTWGLLTNANKIVYGGTSAGGDNLRPASASIVNSEIIVGSSASDQPTLAASFHGALLNTASFQSVNVKKLNASIYLEKIQRVNDDLMIIRGTPSYYEREIGCDATGAYANVLQHFATGSGQTRLLIGSYRVGFLEQHIIVRRRIVSLSTGVNTNLLKTAFVGKTNSNSSYLGYGAGTHLLLGGQYGYNYSLDGTSREFTVDWHLILKLAFGSGGVSTGWFNSRNPYNRVVTVAATISVDGDTSISSLNSAWTVQTPAQADQSFVYS